MHVSAVSMCCMCVFVNVGLRSLEFYPSTLIVSVARIEKLLNQGWQYYSGLMFCAGQGLYIIQLQQES